MANKQYANFAKPLTSILAALKKEQTEKFETEHKSADFHTDIFPDYVFDLSDADLAPIPATYYYKKSHASKHRYIFEKPAVVYTPRPLNYFKELALFLTELLEDNPIVNDDFLTGYYLAAVFIIPNIIDNLISGTAKNLKSFHPGITSDGIIVGIKYAFANYNKHHPTDGIHWEFLGCDVRRVSQYKTKYLNGVTKNCNIFDINSIRSVSIQVEEKLDKLDFLISDIKPASIADMTSQLILIHSLVQQKGISVIRVLNDWYTSYTQMVNLLVYCISSYSVVKIFKTPWGVVGKLYLVLSQPKNKALTAPHKTGLIKYHDAVLHDTSVSLHNQMVFNVEEPDINYSAVAVDDDTRVINDIANRLTGESYMTQLKDNIADRYTSIISHDMEFESPERCTAMWMSHIGGIDE